LKKQGFLQRIKTAYNAYNGRFVTLDKDGFPAYSMATSTGLSISAERALYATAVFSCVNLLSSIIASLPLKLYNTDKTGDIKEATSNPLYRLMMYMPNRFQTAYEYWLYNMECILLRGGFISWKNRSSNGKILSLIALHPDTVTRELTDDGRILISGIAEWGPNKHLRFDKTPQDQFFWANYRTLDGLNPVSPVKYAAESIALALTAEEHGARTFQNDAVPPLVVSFPEKLSKEHLLNVSKSWTEGGTGTNYGMPRFLDGGPKLERLKMSNEDAQYFETRRFQKEDICGIFRVPPSMIGDTQRAQGWSTLEQKNSDFLTYTLSPYLTNIEQAIQRSLIPQSEWGFTYPDFDTKALMRADITARTAYYRGMKEIGVLNPNEIRAEEGLNRRPGGDAYTISANTRSESDSANQEQKKTTQKEDSEDEQISENN